MSEMIQRVARALAQLEGHENLPTLQSAYEQRARVAIEAMMEPTEEMVVKGHALSNCVCDQDAYPQDVWPEMISAALEEQHQ